MVNPTPASFYTDGGVYDEADVVGNDNPASTTPSQTPSSFFSDGGVAGEGEVISNDTVPSVDPSNTPGSFFKDGGLVGAETVTNNDNVPDNSPRQATSSFYPDGNLYDALSEESAMYAAMQVLLTQTQESQADAANHDTSAAAHDVSAASHDVSATAHDASAATHDTNASNSATAAAASASSAASHDSSAATHDTNAAASASAASTSATNAAASAASAASHDAASATHDTNSGTSATNAAASASAAASSAATAAATLAGKVNKAGDSMTGALTVSGGVTVTTGGIWDYGWGGNNNAGVVFLNIAANRYLFYDGSQYNLNGAVVSASNGRLWGASDFNYTPVNKAGDTITGGLTVNGELVAATNYIRFVASGSTGYLQWNGGATYTLGGAGTVWTTGNINPVINLRTAFSGDFTTHGNQGMTEPFGANAAVTGHAWESGGSFSGTYFSGVTARYRQLQYQTSDGVWRSFGAV